MTHAERHQTSGTSNPEAQGGAQFAAFVADLQARTVPPSPQAQECRELLAENPQTLRALFDIAEAHSRPSDVRLGWQGWLAVVLVLAVLLTGAILLGQALV
jgi:hypothetical protein